MKAEFDSLKNDFQSQIDQYNTSIDSKIDGAIAAYLAGIRVETKTTLNSILNQVNKNGGGKFKSLDIIDPEQTNEINFDVYIEGWMDWAVNTSPKSGWRVTSTQNGEGKVWTYSDYQGYYYPFKYYSKAYIKIAASGTVFVGSNQTMGYADPLAQTPNKLGTTGGNSWSYFVKNGSNCFANYTLTGNYNSGEDMSKYSAPASVSHTKHKLLKESEKLTQTVERDGSESKTMTVTMWSASNYSGGSPGTSANFAKWKWKTTEFYDDELICYPASVAYGDKVLLWEGLPIFYTKQSGEVKFKLQKTGSGAGEIRIKNGKFSNAALPDKKDCVWSQTASSGTATYEVAFKVNQDSEYWIKCDNNINVDVEEIILTSS